MVGDLKQPCEYTKMISKKYTVNSVDSTNLGISDIVVTQSNDTTVENNITVYSFTIGEVGGKVYLVPREGVSHVLFEALNNFVPSLEDAETNFNAHTFFRFIMAAVVAPCSRAMARLSESQPRGLMMLRALISLCRHRNYLPCIAVLELQ